MLEEVARGDAGGVRCSSRVTLLMTAAVLALFAVGYLFSEVWPIPLFIRLQPFRASRVLMILMLVHIAHGAIVAIRGEAHQVTATGSDGTSFRVPRAARIAESRRGHDDSRDAGHTLILAAFCPALWSWPWCATAMVAGHVTWRQSALATAALVVTVLANRQIEFPLLPANFSLFSQAGPNPADLVASLGWLALFVSAHRWRSLSGYYGKAGRGWWPLR